jgi:hypothetical protein
MRGGRVFKGKFAAVGLDMFGDDDDADFGSDFDGVGIRDDGALIEALLIGCDCVGF